MKWRSALFAAGILLATLGVADTAAWMFATRALRSGIEAWAERQRAFGTAVTVTEPVAGGWPLAATARYDARIGPGGVPAGMVLDAALTSRLSPAEPRLVRTEIGRAQLTSPAGGDLVATASAWTIDVPLAEPDRGAMRASDMVFVWGPHTARVASVTGTASGGQASSHLSLAAQDIDLGRSGLAMPAALGSRLRSLDLDAVLHGGLPAPAATATASARAWQESGGGVEVARLALQYGPLDATAQGRLGLDAALRPTGSGNVQARGLVPLLDALGASGVIPPRAGQAASGVLALLGAGAGGQVDLPVTVADGRISVAGFPLARLPRLEWEPAEGEH